MAQVEKKKIIQGSSYININEFGARLITVVRQSINIVH